MRLVKMVICYHPRPTSSKYGNSYLKLEKKDRYIKKASLQEPWPSGERGSQPMMTPQDESQGNKYSGVLHLPFSDLRLMFTKVQNIWKPVGKRTHQFIPEEWITQDTELGKEWWEWLEGQKENGQHKYKFIKAQSCIYFLCFSQPSSILQIVVK